MKTQPTSTEARKGFPWHRTWFLALCCAFLASGSPLSAEDMVTIPKSRLKELEAKEAELQKLKGEYTKTKTEKEQLQKKYDETAASVAASPVTTVPAHVSPPIDSLPPLEEGQVVDSMDLANYYKTDPKAADERFRKKRFRVKGEVAAFSKPLFVRPYKIVLKSPDPTLAVSCEVTPPDKYKSVFTAKNGMELVGLIGETRVPLLKVGDKVVLEGECRGERNGVVTFWWCKFEDAQ